MLVHVSGSRAVRTRDYLPSPNIKIICNPYGSVSLVVQLCSHVKVVLQVRSALAVSSGRYESFTAAQMAALFNVSVITVTDESNVTYKRLVPSKQHNASFRVRSNFKPHTIVTGKAARNMSSKIYQAVHE